MSNNKQSSVRWIVEELEKFELGTSEFYSKTAIINRGDRMHREEIIDAVDSQQSIWNEPNGDDYYNETYGGNKWEQ